jgi:fluoroquinolone transport system permease protein
MRATPWRALAAADSKLLLRDPLLGWVVLLPLGLALLLRQLIPAIGAAVAAGGVMLEPYYPLIMSGYLMTAPGIVGMVVGFLLIDERDERTLSALRVTPLSMRAYLAYRVTGPLIVGTFSTLMGYPLIGLTPLPLHVLVPIAAVAALSAPVLALVLPLAAPNKVAGFAVVKVMNVVSLLPIMAYFIPRPAHYIAGILPTFWPMRALWSAAAGEPYLLDVTAGAAVAAIAISLAAMLFERRLLLRA